MNKPLVSIIIPVYKGEKYLEECVESVFAQSYPNWELILVDDGSPDNCPALCESFAQRDNRLKVIHQENHGQSHARNTGFDASAGKYVCVIDQDDTVAPDYLEKLTEAAEREQADIVVCSYAQYDDESGKQLRSAGQKDAAHRFSSGHYFIVAFIYPWAKLFRRDFLDRFSIRFSVGEDMEDAMHSIESYSLTKNVAFANTLYLWRKHMNSTSTQHDRGARVYRLPQRGYLHLIENVRKNLPTESDRSVLAYYVIWAFSASLFRGLTNQTFAVIEEAAELYGGIVRTYFPHALCRPLFFGKGEPCFRTLPWLHRAAMRTFLVMEKLHLLRPFTVTYMFFLRLAPLPH